MKSFELTEAARADLLDIWDYIRVDNIDAAVKVIDRLHDAFVKLGRNPRMGHVREDLADPEHRSFPIYSYLIVQLAIKSIRIDVEREAATRSVNDEEHR